MHKFKSTEERSFCWHTRYRFVVLYYLVTLYISLPLGAIRYFLNDDVIVHQVIVNNNMCLLMWMRTLAMCKCVLLCGWFHCERNISAFIVSCVPFKEFYIESWLTTVSTVFDRLKCAFPVLPMLRILFSSL